MVKMVNMNEVVSSNIKSIGFDNDINELYIQFKNGATYKYSGVTPEVYEAMMISPSKPSSRTEWLQLGVR